MINLLLNNILFIFLITTTIGFDKDVLPIENDVTRMKLKGNVKSLLLVYNFKSKNDTSKTFLKKPTDYKYVRFTSFNTFGFETENIRYNNGSDVLDRRIRNYDSNGNRVLSSFYDSIGELTLKVVEKYDMNGNKINILGYGRIGKLYSKETVFRQTQILLQAKGCT